MLSQLLAAADSAGLGPRLFSRFPDAAVAALVGADRVHEWPVAIVALGGDAPALGATEVATTGRVDAAPVEFPLVTAAQRAGEVDDLGPPWEPGPAVEVNDRGDGRSVEAAVLSRGSQRLMDPTRGLPVATLRSCLGVAVRGFGLPHIGSWSTMSAHSRRVSTAGPTSPRQRAPATCARSCTASVWIRGSPGTPRSS
jgi:hypothetical protein